MLRHLLVSIIFLGLSGLSSAFAVETVSFGFAVGVGGIHSADDARVFASRLAGELNTRVKVRLFSSEADLRQWISRYQEVDCAWMSSTFLEALPDGELIPLQPSSHQDTTQVPGQFVLRQSVSPNLVQQLRRVLPNISRPADGVATLPTKVPSSSSLPAKLAAQPLPQRADVPTLPTKVPSSSSLPAKLAAQPLPQRTDVPTLPSKVPTSPSPSVQLVAQPNQANEVNQGDGASVNVVQTRGEKAVITDLLAASNVWQTVNTNGQLSQEAQDVRQRELTQHASHATGVALASGPSASIPLDSWVYPAIDKLAGLGLIDSSLFGSRPYSRFEAARLVREACDRIQQVSTPLPVALELLERLEKELHPQLNEFGSVVAGSYFKPVRELRFESIQQDGFPLSIAGTDAWQFPLNYNNFGIDYDDGSNSQLTLETELRLGQSLLLNWRPYLLVDKEDTHFRTQHATATLGLGPFNVSIGRESLWWGQGRHGSLVLTNNAKPLDMVRVTNPSPFLLPWVFEYLGPFRFDLFWSRLDDYVANTATGRGDDPYFAGLRLNFKPLPWFELGASRAVIFGGDDINVGRSDYLTILVGKNLDAEDTSNSVAAVDARLRLPFLWGAELYGEMGGEDEAGAWIANRAWLAGLYLPRLEPTGRLSLRLEHADLSHVDSNSPGWYRHGTYKAGYTNENHILGHHVGGYARDSYGEVELRLPNDITLTTGLDLEERGTDRPVQEKHLQPFTRLSWNVFDWLALTVDYAYDQVKNYGFERGEERNFHLARIAVSGSW